jgi:sugar phosphate permease
MPTSAVSANDRVYARICLRLLPVLMFAYVAAQLDRVNVGFAKAQMQSALEFSDAVYGRVGSRNFLYRLLPL